MGEEESGTEDDTGGRGVPESAPVPDDDDGGVVGLEMIGGADEVRSEMAVSDRVEDSKSRKGLKSAILGLGESLGVWVSEPSPPSNCCCEVMVRLCWS